MSGSLRVPSSSNIDNGFDFMNKRHRSPASHPLGFPLMPIFHSVDGTFPNRHISERRNDIEEIFKNAFHKWKGNELDLTRDLSTELDNTCQPPFTSVVAPVGESKKRGKYGITDFLMLSEPPLESLSDAKCASNQSGSTETEYRCGEETSNRNKQSRTITSKNVNNDETKFIEAKARSFELERDHISPLTTSPNENSLPDPIALFEVGLDRYNFFSKLGLGERYLQLMTSKKSQYKFIKPMLLVIITIGASGKSKKTKTKKRKQKKAKRKPTARPQRACAVDSGVKIERALAQKSNENRKRAPCESNATTAKQSSETRKRAAVNKSSDAENESNDNRQFVGGRIGVFLCWHNNPDKPSSDDILLTLLYRNHTTSLDDFSRMFGTVIHAAENLDSWLRADLNLPKWQKNPVKWDYDNIHHEYEFLGPSCCMFQTAETKYVLRCYDNRFRATDRNPTIYNEYSNIFGDSNQWSISSYLFDKLANSDGTHESETTAAQPEENNDTLTVETRNSAYDVDDTMDHSAISTSEQKSRDYDRLWRDEGQLIVIKIPYIAGNHRPYRLGQFLPIINQLQCLHEKQYVHGDVRLYNMVFSKNSASLIDFDLGGPQGKSKVYPHGYKKSLDDGKRYGIPGKQIWCGHDWYAVAQVIFSINPIDTTNIGYDAGLHYNLFGKLTGLIDHETFDDDVKEAVDCLLEYVNEHESWKCSPEIVLKKALDASVPPDYATGSPQTVTNRI